MENSIKLWLADIKRSVVEIYSFLPDGNDFALFQQDLKGRKAIERNLEIIGEALNRILKADPTFQINNARRIINTRNRIIHGYDTVSEDIIWAIVKNELPLLEKEIDVLLK